MNDVSVVGVGHRVEHRDEQAYLLLDAVRTAAGRGEQIFAFDVLESEKPDTGIRASAVEKAGDSRVLERGEDAHLVAESPHRVGVELGRIEELQGDPPAKSRRLLLREIDPPMPPRPISRSPTTTASSTAARP